MEAAQTDWDVLKSCVFEEEAASTNIRSVAQYQCPGLLDWIALYLDKLPLI